MSDWVLVIRAEVVLRPVDNPGLCVASYWVTCFSRSKALFWGAIESSEDSVGEFVFEGIVGSAHLLGTNVYMPPSIASNQVEMLLSRDEAWILQFILRSSPCSVAT